MFLNFFPKSANPNCTLIIYTCVFIFLCFSALLELHLSCVRSASEETMAVLEEVIMLGFQQCVYYITKVRGWPSTQVEDTQHLIRCVYIHCLVKVNCYTRPLSERTDIMSWYPKYLCEYAGILVSSVERYISTLGNIFWARGDACNQAPSSSSSRWWCVV